MVQRGAGLHRRRRHLPGEPLLPLESHLAAGCADALALYLKLRAVSPAPHAAFMQLAGTTVLSASPELFLRMHSSRIATRPIKGTRPRFAGDPERDSRRRARTHRLRQRTRRTAHDHRP
jgi:anthranilate/para-aminobenzoate synthase component I